MISHGKLTSLLLQVFDDVGVKKSSNKEEKFKSIEDVLEWIVEGADPWLNECVTYHKGTLNNSGYVRL